LFVQHTVVDGATVSGEGLYAYPLIATSTSPGWQGPTAAPAGCPRRTTSAAQAAEIADRTRIALTAG
jgi:hypothetical protein